MSVNESTLAEAKANISVNTILLGKLQNPQNSPGEMLLRFLKGIKKSTFDQFSNNPEEFIIKASKLIDEQKATVIVEHIEYDLLGQV